MKSFQTDRLFKAQHFHTQKALKHFVHQNSSCVLRFCKHSCKKHFKTNLQVNADHCTENVQCTFSNLTFRDKYYKMNAVDFYSLFVYCAPGYPGIARSREVTNFWRQFSKIFSLFFFCTRIFRKRIHLQFLICTARGYRMFCLKN